MSDIFLSGFLYSLIHDYSERVELGISVVAGHIDVGSPQDTRNLPVEKIKITILTLCTR